MSVAIGFAAKLRIQGCVEALQVLLASALPLMGVGHVALSHPEAVEGQRLGQQVIGENPQSPRRGLLGQPALSCLPNARPELGKSRLIGRSLRACVVILLEAQSECHEGGESLLKFV
jgi:hypothetical protein